VQLHYPDIGRNADDWALVSAIALCGVFCLQSLILLELYYQMNFILLPLIMFLIQF